MNQAKRAAIKRRKVTPETKAGQYMSYECGQIFDTKKEVDSHIRKNHKQPLNPSKMASTLNKPHYFPIRFTAFLVGYYGYF